MISALATSWALLLGMALLMLGNGLQGTLLGVRANLEGFSTTITGILMSGYFAGFLIGSVLAPRLVQRVGHARTFAALASLASTAILAHSVFVEPITWVLMRLVSGFCYAGLYVVAESWLNEQATNETRGQLLSIYMVVSLGGMGLGQILLNAADPAGSELFILVSVLVSLALLPMLLSVIPGPPIEVGGRRAGIRELLRASPTGVIGMFMTLTAQGAFTGMGAVYAGRAGLDVREISFFMGVMVLGGVLLQWPIGRLSDRFDRRRVMTCVTLLAGLLAGSATLVEPSSPLMLVLVGLYGGMAMPMYSLCIAYTNDYLNHDQMVEASGTLVLVAGLGASLGPVT
ncbi:MAG: MFS transporter, partial [Geminicoccaceae bacterium]|nr:MFS transporter [Geminicoccaceae bacterium]